MAYYQFESGFRADEIAQLHQRIDKWIQEQKARALAVGVPFLVHGMFGTHYNAEHNYMVTVFYDGAPLTLTRSVVASPTPDM